jgi:hypothetical protein
MKQALAALHIRCVRSLRECVVEGTKTYKLLTASANIETD